MSSFFFPSSHSHGNSSSSNTPSGTNNNNNSNGNGNTLTSPVEFLSRILAPPLPPILAASGSRGSSLGLTPKTDYRLFDSNTSTEENNSHTTNAITTLPYSLYSPPILHQNSTSSIVRAPSIHEFILGDRIPVTDIVHGSEIESSLQRLMLSTYGDDSNNNNTEHTHNSPLFRSPRPSSINLGTTNGNGSSNPPNSNNGSVVIHHHHHHPQRSFSSGSINLSIQNFPVLPASSSSSLSFVHGGLAYSSSSHPHSVSLPPSSDTSSSSSLLPPSSLITVPSSVLPPVKKILFSPKLINFLKWGNKEQENEETVRKRAIVLHALQTPVMIPPTLQNRMPGIISNASLFPSDNGNNNSNMNTEEINRSNEVILPTNYTNPLSVPPVHSVVLWNRPRSNSFSGTSLREDNLIMQYREGIELKKLVLATAKIRTKQEAKISTLLSLLVFECVSRVYDRE